MIETIRERIVRLVREMQNRTVDRGCTSAEAAGFGAKVAEWVERYQIDEAELRAAGAAGGASNETIEVCQNTLRTGKKVFNPGTTQVVNALAVGMCCRCILLHHQYNGVTEAVYGIVGEQLDADYVCQVAICVVTALQITASLEGREHGYEKAGLVRWSNMYLTGAGAAIKERLEADRNSRSCARVLAHEVTANALVCVTGNTLAVARREAADQVFGQMYPHTKKNNSRVEYNEAAYTAGVTAGRHVGLNVAIE